MPARTATKCQSGAFIELEEFLPDNLQLLRQLEDHPELKGDFAGRTKLRVIKTPRTWASCFATYAAIVAASAPARAQALFAYMRVILRLSGAHPQRWLPYDKLFRQQAEADPSCDWTRLDSDLLAAVLSANETQPPTCEHCREVDHSTEECSLFVLQPGRALVAVASAAAAAPPPTPLTRPSNSNRRTSVGNPPPVCRNFNFSDKEGCTRRGCTYRHCCLLCGGPHKIPSCPDNPDREPAGSLAETTPRGRGGSLRLLPREP